MNASSSSRNLLLGRKDKRAGVLLEHTLQHDWILPFLIGNILLIYRVSKTCGDIQSHWKISLRVVIVVVFWTRAPNSCALGSKWEAGNVRPLLLVFWQSVTITIHCSFPFYGFATLAFCYNTDDFPQSRISFCFYTRSNKVFACSRSSCFIGHESFSR